MIGSPVIIGQDNPFITAIENGLIASGVTVAEAELAIGQPWTTLPIVSWLVDSGIKFAITEVVGAVDMIGYRIYVAIDDAERVSAYQAAQASNNQAAIDAAADALLKLGSS